MRITEIIGKSFELWVSNLFIIVPFIIQAVISAVIFLPFVLFLIYPNLVSIQNLVNVADLQQQLVSKILSSYYYIGVFIILIVALMIASAFITSGVIGMAKDMSNGKKARFKTLLDYGKKYWKKYFIASLLIGLIIFFVLFVFSPVFLAFAMFGLSESLINIITVIFIIAFALFAIMLIPTTILVVVNEFAPVKAIKESLRISRNNYGSLLLLLLILVIINSLISLIPYMGDLIAFFIINPIQTIALVLFVMDRGKIKDKKKK